MSALIAACGAGPPHPSPQMTLAEPQPTPSAYVMQVGDALGVRFYNSPDLNEEVIIRPDGKISLQLIGDVMAAGRTPDALANDLEQAYRNELATPRIVVIVRTYGAQRIHVGGEVGESGAIPMSTGLTAFQAIQEARGFLKTAHVSQVILIRREKEGQPVGYTMDMRPVRNGLAPQEDIPLEPGDIVFVPRSKIANVNLFVEQYISNNIPPIPVAIPVF